uniref:Uncharacterized protein n=1 Tax=Rhizophora mucronata TaxID=61149 RepID=A0A2P2R002_RHIMU
MSKSHSTRDQKNLDIKSAKCNKSMMHIMENVLQLKSAVVFYFYFLVLQGDCFLNRGLFFNF